jgi:hypothetical protein
MGHNLAAPLVGGLLLQRGRAIPLDVPWAVAGRRHRRQIEARGGSTWERRSVCGNDRKDSHGAQYWSHEFYRPKRGDIRQGVLLLVEKDKALVDRGVKREPILPKKDLELLGEEAMTELAVGDEVALYVMSPEDRGECSGLLWPPSGIRASIPDRCDGPWAQARGEDGAVSRLGGQEAAIQGD